MSRVWLSRLAESDLDEIDLRTLKLFGFKQSEDTAGAIQRALQRLADHPQSGHPREDLSPAGRALLYWPVLHRFLIVYEPAADGGGIRVARILDGTQDLGSILRDD